MFLRSITRKKNGKEHRYFSIVENKRLADGRVVHRHFLDAFSQGPWGKKYPPIALIWKRQWEQIIPFFSYPVEVRKIIYTTNAIESLHMQLRKIIKNRGHFPNDEAAVKLLYLALRNITKDWKMSAREWKSALNQFAILFADRFEPQLH
jgi:putative transposase